MSENRLALVHRAIIPDIDYPKEYAILITDKRSIFIHQPKTRSNFALRGEMKWGTALVTDVVPKTLEDYDHIDLESLSAEPSNFLVPHDSLVLLKVRGDRPSFRRRDFLVKWTMQRQKEIFQVYNFEMNYQGTSNRADQVKFYAVPLGAYFKPRRQTQTRQTILREYAEYILEIYRSLLPAGSIDAWFNDQPVN